MSDTTETVTYHLSVGVADGDQWWSTEVDLKLPIDDTAALALAQAFMDVLPPAPATQVAITRINQTTTKSISNFTVDPPVIG